MQIVESFSHDGFGFEYTIIGHTTLSCTHTVTKIESVTCYRHLFSDLHTRTDNDGELVIVGRSGPDDRVTCLDGSSRPGYYVRQGKSGNLMLTHSLIDPL